MTLPPRNLILAVALAVACGAPPSGADRNATARARLDAVVAAAGGDSVLGAIRTLVAHYDFTELTTGPGGGAPTSSVEVLQVRDFVNGRNLYEAHRPPPGESWERVVMEPGNAFSVDLTTGEVREFDTPAAAVAEYSDLQLRWYVYHALTQARMSSSTLRHVGDTLVDGTTHDIITYLHETLGEVRVYVDTATSRIRREAWTVPGSVARRVQLDFLNYDDTAGLPMPMTVVVHDHEIPTARYDMVGIQLNVQLQEAAFTPPATP